MCGVFGFDGGSPDRGILKEIALGAATRGPHAYGFAYFHTLGDLAFFKEAGHLEDNLHRLEMLEDAQAAIGQARLATSGEWWENANNQPLTMIERAIVHNGNVYNAREIFEEYEWRPMTASDSEAILCLAENAERTSLPEIIAGRVDRRSPMAVLVLDRSGVIAFRTGHPLYQMERGGVRYWCSRKTHSDMILLEEVH